RPRQVGARGVAGEAHDRAARIRAPAGRVEAGEGGDEVDVSGILDRGRELLDLRGVADEAQVVAQPVDERSRDGDRALERVLRRLSGLLERDGGDESAAGALDRGAGVREEEAARAVRALRLSRREGALAERGGLLV